MFEDMVATVARYDELSRLLSSPQVISDPESIRIYSQEQSGLSDLVEAYRRYVALSEEIRETQAMLTEDQGPEMSELIRAELKELEESLQEAEERLTLLLLPKDPRDSRNVIVEIRAGTGGEEAALFAANLFDMYAQYAAKQGWETRVLSTNETGIGGYKEIIFDVRGKGAFSRLKYESGVHRVQRVPVTESSGRIHTSAATVAVLPEASEVDVEIDDKDLRVDVFRSGGKGGQSVNTTDSAVRITHTPSGIVVQCQNERSQLQNRARAMAVLRARLYAVEYQREFDKIDEARRQQVGSGDRSEKIRTYNFPQNRVTDHRIGFTVHQLESVLAGQLDDFIDNLATHEREERIGVRAN